MDQNDSATAQEEEKYEKEMSQIFLNEINVDPEVSSASDAIDEKSNVIKKQFKENEPPLKKRRILKNKVRKLERVQFNQKDYHTARLEIEREKLEEMRKQNDLLKEANMIMKEQNEILKRKCNCCGK